MNECLIYFKFSTLESKDKIKNVLADTKSFLTFNKISSVFKRKNLKSASLDEIQEFVIRASTEHNASELLNKLKHHAELLVFNDEIKMIPSQTLPHPNLFLDPLILHCSAEVWPEYIHPVNKITLRKSDIETNVEMYEFLYQGKFFLDP